MRKMILLFISVLLVSFLITGCLNSHFLKNNSSLEDPGSALPVLVCYNGILYSHDGKVTYELPENVQFLGKTKNVGSSSISENFDANDSGYLYEENDNSDLLYFQYEKWDEKTDGGKEPYLLLYRKK